MQKPPPRIERTTFAKHHLLLPDGYWDPPKKEGGVGAVLLREGDLPYTLGGMVPEHLAFQLLSMQEGHKKKEQRNTQAELLAVLMAILMWHDDLQGQSLLILTESTAALNNCREGTAADQQSRDLVSTILFLGSVFRIHIWFAWVFSKQNPGDPYSRPKT